MASNPSSPSVIIFRGPLGQSKDTTGSPTDKASSNTIGKHSVIRTHGIQTVILKGFRACCAAGDVDVFADQVAVDPGDEIVRVEIDVLDLGIELGRDVVAQPLGVHAEFEVFQRRDPGAPALAHLLAADGDEAVHEDVVRRLAAAEMQHRRPEQRVEVGDVLADEMHLLGVRVGHEGVEVAALAVEQVLQRGQVADRRIEPDIEIFVVGIGNADAEIRRVAADVPVGQPAVAVFVDGKPFLDLVQHLGLQPARAREPIARGSRCSGAN